MTPAVLWPDVLRGAAIVLGVVAMATFPPAIVHRIPGWRAWVVAVVLLLMFGSMISATWAHLGGAHIRWYRSPVLLLCSILALTYVVSIRGWNILYDPPRDERSPTPR